jgi:uncharacterized delta-60 repeat protein
MTSKQLITWALIFGYVMLGFKVYAQDKPGDLDVAFHNDGKTTTDFGTINDRISAMVVQPDGKLIGAGKSYKQNGNYNDFDVLLIRYHVDGQLDYSFGTGGKVVMDFDSSETVTSIALQGDGKIIIAGYRVGKEIDVMVARLHANGTLDYSFGQQGKVFTNIRKVDYAMDIALQSDGKILVAGYTRNNNFKESDVLVIRYHTDGTRDYSFSGDGIVTTDLKTNNMDFGRSIAVQTNGKIVVCGETKDGDKDIEVAVLRYHADGTLDYSFSGDGKLTVNVGTGPDYGDKLAIQKDGKILVAGKNQDSKYQMMVIRLHGDGIFDYSFNSNGKLIFAPNNAAYSSLSDVKVQKDGKILLTGGLGTIGDQDFSIIRLNDHGGYDNTFGEDGLVVTDFKGGANNSNDLVNCMVIQPDHKIVLAGLSYHDGTGYDCSVARYHSGVSTLSTRELVINESNNVYPNPFQDYLSVKLEESNGVSFRLVSLEGKTVQLFSQFEFDNDGEIRLNINSELRSGIYFLEITGMTGERKYTRVIKN